ncbi:phage late control D family protein [Herbidospora galbida]|nr:contractile injection system protein, VgrG/Pvc8 family [Herbidospora galbida]
MDLRVQQRLGENTIMSARVHHAYHQVKNPKILKEDSLIQVNWGTKPTGNETWFGYIHHPQFDSSAPDRNGNVEINYLMVGTGHLLTDQRRKTWLKMSDSAIAREIAKQYGLSSVVHKTSKVHEWLLQDGESDMAFLTRRAKESGRKFWVENAVLYFVDVAAWSAGKGIVMPEYDVHKDPNLPTDVLRFQADVGADMPQQGRQYRRAIHGVDHQTGKMIKSKNADDSKARHDVLGYTRADNMEDLNYQLDAHTISTSEWVGASATLAGDIILTPGQPIKIKGRAVPKDAHGVWMIVAADHRLRSYGSAAVGNSMFLTDVKLARNAREDYATSDTTMPRLNQKCVPGSDGWKAASMQDITL